MTGRPAAFPLVAAVSLLLSPVPAQIGPGIVKTAPGDNSRPPDAAALSPAALGHGITHIGQISLRPLGGGLHRLCATVKGLSVAMGGKGAWDVVEGFFDQRTQTVALTSLAAALNTTGAEFSLSVSDDGLRCVLDQPTGCMGSSRTTPTVAFAAPAPIAGLPAGVGPYCNAKLYVEEGVERFAFVDTNGGISGGDFVLGTVKNVHQILATPGLSHSPEPMVDSNGDLRAWVVGNWNGFADSDSYLMPDVGDQAIAPVLIHDDTQWQGNPTRLGWSGTTYWAYSGRTGYATPRELALVAVQGQCWDGMAGSWTLRPRVFVPDNGSAWFVALVMGLNSAPVSIPGTIGNRLAPAPSGSRPPGVLAIAGPIVVVTGLAAAGTGGVSFELPVPSVPSWASLDIQAAAVDMSSLTLVIGNTATLHAGGRHPATHTLVVARGTTTNHALPRGSTIVHGPYSSATTNVLPTIKRDNSGNVTGIDIMAISAPGAVVALQFRRTGTSPIEEHRIQVVVS